MKNIILSIIVSLVMLSNAIAITKVPKINPEQNKIYLGKTPVNPINSDDDLEDPPSKPEKNNPTTYDIDETDTKTYTIGDSSRGTWSWRYSCSDYISDNGFISNISFWNIKNQRFEKMRFTCDELLESGQPKNNPIQSSNLFKMKDSGTLYELPSEVFVAGIVLGFDYYDTSSIKIDQSKSFDELMDGVSSLVTIYNDNDFGLLSEDQASCPTGWILTGLRVSYQGQDDVSDYAYIEAIELTCSRIVVNEN